MLKGVREKRECLLIVVSRTRRFIYTHILLPNLPISIHAYIYFNNVTQSAILSSGKKIQLQPNTLTANRHERGYKVHAMRKTLCLYVTGQITLCLSIAAAALCTV